MKSIHKKDFVSVGFICKTHGTKGELRIDLKSEIELKEWVMIEINQKPVPFFIEKFTATHSDEAIIKLRDINSLIDAEVLKNRNLLYPKSEVEKTSSGYYGQEIIGYKLIDKKLGEIGVIEEIEEFPFQTILKSTFKNKEVLIPAVNEFIVEINDDEQLIFLELPDDLI